MTPSKVTCKWPTQRFGDQDRSRPESPSAGGVYWKFSERPQGSHREKPSHPYATWVTTKRKTCWKNPDPSGDVVGGGNNLGSCSTEYLAYWIILGIIYTTQLYRDYNDYKDPYQRTSIMLESRRVFFVNPCEFPLEVWSGPGSGWGGASQCRQGSLAARTAVRTWVISINSCQKGSVNLKLLRLFLFAVSEVSQCCCLLKDSIQKIRRKPAYLKSRKRSVHQEFQVACINKICLWTCASILS